MFRAEKLARQSEKRVTHASVCGCTTGSNRSLPKVKVGSTVFDRDIVSHDQSEQPRALGKPNKTYCREDENDRSNLESRGHVRSRVSSNVPP